MATIRENDVILDIAGISDVTFVLNDYSITTNQPWDGISTKKQSESQWVITARAGRKGSSDVADWFRKKTDGGLVAGCDSYDITPTDLNFAFLGDLSFKRNGKNLTIFNVTLGQGHNSKGRNNWWIGIRETAVYEVEGGKNVAQKINVFIKAGTDISVNVFTITLTDY